MKVKKFFTLSLESIDDAYEFVQKLLLKYNCSKSDIVRAQLFVEETIVHWQKGAQENETFEISLSKRFKTITLSLNYWGNQSDPLTLPEEVDDPEFNLIGQNILIGLSSVTYSYENGCNNVSYTLKVKSANPALTTAIALVAGIFCGLAFQYFSPSTGLWIADTILNPLSGTFFGFLNAMVVPVLFLSAIGSIFNMDNIAQMKRIFRSLLSWSLGIILVSSAISLLAAWLFFVSEGSASSGGGTGDLWNQIGTMVFGIIPTNILQPFLDGNTLQIMFLAIVSGVVMLTLKGRFPFITKIITEGNLIFTTILDAVCTMMPWVVFISILNMMVSGNGGALLGSIGLIAIILVSLLALVVIMLISVALIEKMNPITYFKSAGSFLLIAFSTASSSATFASHTLIASVKQGVRDYVVSFSIPVGVLFNKQFAIPVLLLTSLFVARFYGIAFTMAEIVPVVILCMILSVAVPPSPGMGPFLFTIVFNLLGIPLEGLALAVTIDIFMDYPSTAGHVMVTNIGMLHTEHMLCTKESKVAYKKPLPL